LRIDPLVVDSVLNILKGKDEEITYDEDDHLALFVKSYKKEDKYALGCLLIDYKNTIYVRIRKNGEVKSEPKEIKECEEVRYFHFPEIKGSAELHHVVVVLGQEKVAKLLSTVIRRILGQNAFLRVRFLFTADREVDIRNQFDDIIRIKSEGILDAFITGMFIKGTRLYDAYEYQKAFTGDIKFHVASWSTHVSPSLQIFHFIF